MGLRLVTLPFLAAVAAVVVLPLHAATTPQIQAKQAQAAEVMREIDAIDEQLSVVSERYDGARVRLQTLRGRLTAERRSLVRARAHYKVAEDRLARLLVSLYDSGRPSALEAIFGVTKVSDMLEVLDAQAAIGRQDDAITEAALSARTRLQHAVHALDVSRREAAATVADLARQRAKIGRGLAQRRALLVTVQAQLAHLEAVERARQERLAALARARLAAEARARAQAQAEAEARARAAAAASAAAAKAKAAAAAKEAATRAAAATTTTTPAPAPAPATPAQAPVTPPPVTTTTVATPAPVVVPAPDPAPDPVVPLAQPSVPLPAPDSQAASIALQYIGVPYQWGGATPAGFDCSGLVSYVFAQLGITLPHHAASQWTLGTPVPADQLQPGDLVFFDNLNHVGIYIGGGQFVDAPHTGSFVRIESMSDPWYASRYVGARRI
jgi:cell wall-associated NlpC family hydrolase